MFSNYKNYSAFSNEAWIPAGKENEYDSLESLHDTIHTLTGLQGHMAWIPFSAFDPIFFLHHCMVDRVFAMWQILYPDTWVMPTPAAMSSFTTSQGQIQDSQTPLTPFFSNFDGAFWTSDTARDISVFGYTYPELAGLSPSNSRAANSTAQAQVMAAVNRLYGASSPASFAFSHAGKRTGSTSRSQTKRDLSADKLPYHSTGSGIYGSGSNPWSLSSAHPPPGTVIVGGRYREWVVNIHAEKQALNSSFFVHMFLGYPPRDSETWSYAPNLVGTMSIFASPAVAGAMDMRGRHTSGTIPLTTALVKQVTSGTLANLEPKSVEAYLSRNLHYRIIKTDGAVVKPAQVAGLGIRVVSSVVRAPSCSAELPQWGGGVSHFDLISAS